MEGGHPLLKTVKRLLYEDESNVLDFKAKQYPFGGATNEERGELIKDILAMVNSWGRTDMRYILIGVREVVGGRSEVLGTEQHLPEHALQQLVNSRTNRVVEFSYHAVGIDDTSIGVIAIPRQERPTYLRKAYGALNADTVYVRRGSSTVAAKPNEVAQMGRSESEVSPRQASLDLKLTRPETKAKYDNFLKAQVECLDIPDSSNIPDFTGIKDQFGLASGGFSPNRDFFRDVAKYLWALKATLKLGFYIRNLGDGTATDVAIRMEVADDDQYTVLTEPVPEAQQYYFPVIDRELGQSPPYAPILRERPNFELKYNLGIVQPGLPLWTDPFYLVANEPGRHILKVELYSNNLPSPKQYTFEVHAQGEIFSVDTEGIIEIGRKQLGL